MIENLWKCAIKVLSLQIQQMWSDSLCAEFPGDAAALRLHELSGVTLLVSLYRMLILSDFSRAHSW